MSTDAAVERRPRSESRRLKLVAGMRVSPDEMNRLREAADREGQTVSNYLRRLAQEAIRTA